MISDASIVGPGLRWVVEQCRAGDDRPGFDRFQWGASLDADDFDRIVPSTVHAELEQEGMLQQDSDGIRLAVSCNSINGIVSIMPADQAVDADHVHLNIDTIWLLKLIWRLVEPGGRAADLGTGSGLIAAYLIARFNQVVATDIHRPSLWYAQLTLDANRVRGRDSSLVCTDIAAGLRPGSFDLVVANPPWSPAFPQDDRGRVVTFADGGPSGTELPSRFLHQSADLLTPRGTAIVLALDPTFDDGRRPLMDTINDLQGRGLHVEVLTSEIFAQGVVFGGLSKRVDDLVAADHVAIVIKNENKVTNAHTSG
jgi:methylase of polypeptide subunit release factors